MFSKDLYCRHVKTRAHLGKDQKPIISMWLDGMDYRLTIVDWSNLKASADDKINVTQKLKFLLGKINNIMGKGENAGYQHFLLFP